MVKLLLVANAVMQYCTNLDSVHILECLNWPGYLKGAILVVAVQGLNLGAINTRPCIQGPMSDLCNAKGGLESSYPEEHNPMQARGN